jgi:hypothetical protein
LVVDTVVVKRGVIIWVLVAVPMLEVSLTALVDDELFTIFVSSRGWITDKLAVTGHIWSAEQFGSYVFIMLIVDAFLRRIMLCHHSGTTYIISARALRWF